MKKSKAMVLYLFLLPQLAGKKNYSFSYSDLYTRLPLAKSTVRGIIATFLFQGFIEEVDTKTGKAFQMTKKGTTEAITIFPGLPRADEAIATVIIVPPQSSASGYEIERATQTLGFFPLRSGVFLRFGEFSIKEITILPKKVRSSVFVCHNLKLEQIEGLETITEAPYGREILRLSSQTHSIVRKLYGSREYKNFRELKNHRVLLEKSFEGIITLLYCNFRIPEKYLPHVNRISNINSLFWSAII